MDYTLIRNLMTEIAIPESGIAKQVIVNDEHVRMILFAFAAAAELAAHAAPTAGTLIFLEGEASITLGEERKEVGSGALVQMAPKLMHSITAKTSLRMLLCVQKSA